MGISSKELIIVGCAVTISAGVLWYLFKGKRQKGSNLRVEILTEESFIEICQNIRQQYSSEYWPAVKACRIERRKYSPRSENYEQIIKRFHGNTKFFSESATEQVSKRYGISHKTFVDSVNYYASFPEIAQYSEELVKPIFNEEVKINLTLEQVRDFMAYYSERFNELNSEYLGDFEDYYIITSQIEDEIYKKHGIEVEELSHEYEKYNTELDDIVGPLKNQTSMVLNSFDDSFEG